MRMRSGPRAALVVTAGVLALSFTGLSTASASPGLVVQEKGLQQKAVEDPAPGQCQQGLGSGTTIANYTIGPLLVFSDGNCQTQSGPPVQPGEIRPGANVGSFKAVN
ncbi:hypothetical protein ACFQ6N_07385 [Kitasatospora sp. NPDC056446]|uniref:hypothetical protein n=1 Tax=Kitasatospora sp. NPDC056446 TaxID=3345819 RepID=UPI0036A5D782